MNNKKGPQKKHHLRTVSKRNQWRAELFVCCMLVDVGDANHVVGLAIDLLRLSDKSELYKTDFSFSQLKDLNCFQQ